MNLTITPTRLQGSVTPPPSKSQAHRLLICAALAEGESRLANLTPSQDIDATRRCLAALREDRRGLPQLDCGESGSTLRFLLPLALVLRGGGVFTGHGRLMERPQEPYFQIFDKQGIFHILEARLSAVNRHYPCCLFTLENYAPLKNQLSIHTKKVIFLIPSARLRTVCASSNPRAVQAERFIDDYRYRFLHAFTGRRTENK